MTTTTTNSQIIVTLEASACHDMNTFHAYHHNFPEVKAEGDSEEQAVERLETQLVLALEHNPGGHGRDEMEKALEQVRQLRSGR